MPWTTLEEWMGDQLALDGLTLDAPDKLMDGRARHDDPPTAKAAALADPGPRAQLRARIVALFLSNPHRFYNDDELVQALDEQHPGLLPHHGPSVVKRRQELVEMQWLEDAKFTRLTRRNHPGIVWRLTAAARAQGLQGAADGDPAMSIE